MDFADVVRARRMVRAYQPGRPVPDAPRSTACSNADRAPSAGFSQGWDFVVLRRPEDLERFWAATTDPAGAGRPLAARHARGARARRLPLRPRPLPGPVRRARQGVERPRRGPLAGARTGTSTPGWRRCSCCSPRSTPASALLLRRPPAARAGGARGASAPADRRIVGVVSVGHAAPDRRSPSLRRGRRSVARGGPRRPVRHPVALRATAEPTRRRAHVPQVRRCQRRRRGPAAVCACTSRNSASRALRCAGDAGAIDAAGARRPRARSSPRPARRCARARSASRSATALARRRRRRAGGRRSARTPATALAEPAAASTAAGSSRRRRVLGQQAQRRLGEAEDRRRRRSRSRRASRGGPLGARLHGHHGVRRRRAGRRR